MSRTSSNVAKYPILSNHVHIWPLVRWIRLPRATCNLHHLLNMNFLKILEFLNFFKIHCIAYQSTQNFIVWCITLSTYVADFSTMAIQRPKKARFGENGPFRLYLNRWYDRFKEFRTSGKALISFLLAKIILKFRMQRIHRPTRKAPVKHHLSLKFSKF